MTKICKSCDLNIISDEKLHCDYCHNNYCSKQCFIKGEKNTSYYSTYEPPYENVNLYFTCCDVQICGSCLSYEIDMISSRNILCDKCDCYFHSDDFKVHPLNVDNDNCTCKLCMNLNNITKYQICPKCHEDNNQKMFFYDDIKTISEFGDILSAYEFDICLEWRNSGLDFNNIKPKSIECKKMEYLNYLYEGNSNDFDHFIKSRSLDCNCEICKKFTYWNNMITGVSPDENDLIKTISIECDCDLCNKINCKTTLLSNMIGNEYILDMTNFWDCGNDFAPLLALNMLAKNESNNCKCSVCKFYSEYK